MYDTAIFWPMMAHVLLIYAIYFLTSIRRTAAIKAGSARSSQFRENRNEPDESVFVHNNLVNQFELPVLFYAVCLSLYVTGGTSTAALFLAWGFVFSRYVHAWIHVTSNRIRYRRPAFIVGYFALGLLWIVLAWSLLTT